MRVVKGLVTGPDKVGEESDGTKGTPVRFVRGQREGRSRSAPTSESREWRVSRPGSPQVGVPSPDTPGSRVGVRG